jgi:hypothetical protein
MKKIALALAGGLLCVASVAQAEEDPEVSAVSKVLDEAIRRDRNYSVDVVNVARVQREGSRGWERVVGRGLFKEADDVAQDLIEKEDSVVKSVAVRSVDYGTSGWRNTTRRQRTPFATPRPPSRFEVAANLPVGTPLAVHLGKEKLDGVKFMIIIDASREAVQRRGYMTASDGVGMLAEANPSLPGIRVTRQDASIPEGSASLRLSEVSETQPNKYFRSYRRTISRSRAVVPVSVVRK